MPEEPPDEINVFICYAKEDRKIARQLYADLKQAGVNPWIDVEDLLPGQKWRLIINQAIKKSSFVIALLSPRSLSKRGFVQKEIRRALDVVDELPPDEIFIIPVRLDACEPLEERLQELHWVDLFPSYEEGLQRILKVFTLTTHQRKQSPTSPDLVDIREHVDRQRHQDLISEYEELSAKLHYLRTVRIRETDASVQFKLDKEIEEAEEQRRQLGQELTSLEQKPEKGGQPEAAQHQQPQEQTPTERRQKRREPQKPKQPQETEKIPTVRLRSEPKTVSDEDSPEVFGLTIRELPWGSGWGPQTSIDNQFEDRGEVVVDHATGLMWQKGGSGSSLVYKDAQKYVTDLNHQRFAGYTDWRLPTIPELLSLVELEEQANDLYITPIFDAEQYWCWSADTSSRSAAWIVSFNDGIVSAYDMVQGTYVRCVRSRRAPGA